MPAHRARMRMGAFLRDRRRLHQLAIDVPIDLGKRVNDPLGVEPRSFALCEPLPAWKQLVPVFQIRSSSGEPGRLLPIWWSAKWMPVMCSSAQREFPFFAQRRALPLLQLVNWADLLCSLA